MLIISVQFVLVMGRLGREDLRLTADSYGTKDTEMGTRAREHASSRDVVSRNEAIQIRLGIKLYFSHSYATPIHTTIPGVQALLSTPQTSTSPLPSPATPLLPKS